MTGASVDYVLRGGRVIDPFTGADEVRDLAIAGTAIASREAAATVGPGTIDVTGLLVVPGLIDFHVHVYDGVSQYGLDADDHCLARGVTTVVDAGSAGAQTYPGFHRLVVEPSRTRVFALLNAVTVGLLAPEIEQATRDQFVVDKAVATIERYPDEIVGVKVRIGARTAADPEYALKAAKEIGLATNKPVMIHITGTRMPLGSVLALLTKGDIVTHCFHGKEEGVLGENQETKEYVRAAVERGIRLDVGHGLGSFSFDVARAAIAAGLLPHHISSDLHAYNAAGPVYDLTTTMSKMLHVGMSLHDVLAATTTQPADALGRLEDLGSLLPGTTGDLTVLEAVAGAWPLDDTEGKREVVRTLLVPRWAVAAGVPRRLGPPILPMPVD